MALLVKYPLTALPKRKPTMIHEKTPFTYTSFFPPSSTRKAESTKKTPNPFDEPPNNPDWLLIFVSVLFLLSLLIVWLVDFPRLLQ